ncbi:ornithine cyclodeaminase [Pseudoalteromonas luteoviolacea]|uniref:Ornithine cyclodeaminase n=1 Tax=Pseudoalteromonas luteoviolacea TaxID=43657 RepID=A0A1C0TTP0_9GAMM|nr:ornithine cyclodeaminase family protein [Pseudoalteromonas luteoviolacea]MBQ4811206.1 ornithine cyclodeaminase family protein [Pseudoalteromonas luteoviolacea]OCQ22688.1 ornithine cyclodeaminase [Pseudoalteromonas luteoviolacea]
MQQINRAQVKQALSFDKLIPALQQGFASNAGMPMRQVFELDENPNNYDAFAVLPAWNHEVIGVKAFTYFPDNFKQDKASLYSKIMLFSRGTGEPLALVDGTEVTLWRTAAVSALAASYLAKQDAKHLVFFGSGNLAPFMMSAHLSVRAYKKVTVIARNQDKAQTLISLMSAQFPQVEFTLSSVSEEVIRTADVISCATGSHSPLFDGNWVSQGTHIDLIGNHHKQYRECDTRIVTRSSVFVDSRANVLNEAGELLIPIAENVFSAEQVKAELTELAKSNTSQRASQSEITLFKSVGTALSDLVTAKLVYDLVQE